VSQEVKFVDHYEVLQVSPNAEAETIDRVFRHLAKRYHPDNAATGDREAFDRVVQAHETLSDPVRRAAFDVSYEEGRAIRWRLVTGAAGGDGFHTDELMRDRLLSLLYIQRRRDVRRAGMGELELEQLLGCPREHIEFHLWYLRNKGFVERTDSGAFAITAPGVDHVAESRTGFGKERLLTEHAGLLPDQALQAPGVPPSGRAPR